MLYNQHARKTQKAEDENNERGKTAKRADIQKLVSLIIGLNIAQLSIIFLLLMLQLGSGYFGAMFLAAGICFVVAIVSIQGALMLKRAYAKSAEQEELLKSLERFNDTLRAQRHDFSNHIQVVSALLEMAEYDEASKYIGKVSADIKTANTTIRTAQPAINALLMAKQNLCDNVGIRFEMDIKELMETLPIESWEICRILGNLIDNAVEAHSMLEKSGKYIRVSIFNWKNRIMLTVTNNGPEIPQGIWNKIFEQDFSTKGENRGDGLHNVVEIAEQCGGDVQFSSDASHTSFTVSLPEKNANSDSLA